MSKSVRLGNTTKEAIVKLAVDKAGYGPQGPRYTELENSQLAMERALRKYIQGPYHEPITMIPARYLSVPNNGIDIVYGERHFYYRFVNRDNALGIPKQAGAFELNGDMAIEFDEWHKEKQELDEEYNQFVHTVRTVLASCTTTKQLLDVWPESKMFIKALNLEPARRAMVDPKLLQQVNELLGVE